MRTVTMSEKHKTLQRVLKQINIETAAMKKIGEGKIEKPRVSTKIQSFGISLP